MSSGQNTAEYTKLRQCRPNLNKILAKTDDNIAILCGDLNQAGLISDYNEQELTSLFMPKTTRAAQLTGIIATKVELNVKNFYTFVDVLEKHKETYKEILEELNKGASTAIRVESDSNVHEGSASATAPICVVVLQQKLVHEFEGDLKKVDESHFHMFEIPEGCASLSDLTHQVMPTYDPTSGYGYRQYIKGESVHPNERILLLDKDGGLFEGYEADQLMKDGQEIKLDVTKWEYVFVQCKSKPSVTPGSLFLYFNPRLACSTDSLSEEESSQLISHYYYLLSTPNIVSLSYEENNYGKNVLSVGVIDIKKSTVKLPKKVIYEMPEKWVKVPVQMFCEGVIKTLLCEGGCEIFTESVNRHGTLGLNGKVHGQVYLFSCAHVLTEHNANNIGRYVYIEGDTDPIAVVEDHIPVRVYNRVNVHNPDRFTKDLAWAKIIANQWSPTIKEIGTVKGIRTPQRKEKVKYYGAASLGVQDDIPIRSTNAATRVEVEGHGWVFYEDVIKLNTFGFFLERGDSGSAMVAQKDTKVVGILMSKGDRNGYACKLAQ